MWKFLRRVSRLGTVALLYAEVPPPDVLKEAMSTPMEHGNWLIVPRKAWTCLRAEPTHRYLFGGYVVSMVPWQPSRRQPASTLAGILKRQMNAGRGHPDHECMLAFRELRRKFLHKYVRPLPPAAEKLMDGDDAWRHYCEVSEHPAWRLRQIEISDPCWDLHEAAAMLRKAFDKRLTDREEAAFCRFATHDPFVKVETYGEPKVARGITATSDSQLHILHPIFSVVEHSVVEQIADLAGFVKGRTPNERLDFTSKILFPADAVVGTDYSTFECSLRPETRLSIERAVFRHMVSRCSERFKRDFETLMSLQDLPVCAHGIGWFGRMTCRCSGDIWTSLGNGLTNYFVTLFVVSRVTGLPFEPDVLHGVFEGDDGAFMIVGHGGHLSLDRFSEACAQMGFSVKREFHTCFEEVGFCQDFCARDKTLLQDPRRMLPKFLLSDAAQKWSSRKQLGLAKAKVLSSIAQYPGCPITWALCARLWSVCSESEAVWDRDWYERRMQQFAAEHGYKETRPSRVAREAYALVFGVSEAVQLDVENYILHKWRIGDPLGGPIPDLVRGRSAKVTIYRDVTLTDLVGLREEPVAIRLPDTLELYLRWHGRRWRRSRGNSWYVHTSTDALLPLSAPDMLIMTQGDALPYIPDGVPRDYSNAYTSLFLA